MSEVTVELSREDILGSLFRGFIKTKNKQPQDKFKNVKKLRSWDEVQELEEYAGVLADGIVLVDIDNEEESEILLNIVKHHKLNTIVTKTTRGMHFYFRYDSDLKNATNKQNFLGLHQDMKVGGRNAISILKFAGKDRKIIYYKPPRLIPKFLLPTKRELSFLDMDAGDGRNNELYAYILTLQNNGFSIDECKQTIRIINSYVLESPLDDDELDVILRDESFKSEDEIKRSTFFNSDGKFLFENFARFMIDKHHIIRIDDQLHIYRNGVYVSDVKYIEALMLGWLDNLSRARRREVIDVMYLISENKKPSNARFICLKNGIFDIKENRLIEHSPNCIIQNMVDVNYNPNAHCEVVDKVLDKLVCNDSGLRGLLEEMIGYTLYRRSEIGKAFILVGDKQNGKSTFLAMLRSLIGSKNTSSLDLTDFEVKFKNADLYGKLANLGDDIRGEYITDSSITKKIITGDRVNVERKGKDPFEFDPYCTCIFSANNIPRVKDPTGAFARRIILIPFDARFSKSDPDYDPFIKTKLLNSEALEYLLLLSIDGLKRVLKNKAFSETSRTIELVNEYHMENNPVLEFFKEVDFKEDILNKTPISAYQKYITWSATLGVKPISQLKWTKEVCKMFDVKTKPVRIDGELMRVFIKK